MARPIWSGSISFGLVSVPVRMYSATQSKELRFHFLDRRDLQPIGYDKVRRDTGESVEPENVIRGFEVDVGIAKVVRNTQHLAALRVRDGVLVLETMYYADEIRKPERVDGKTDLRKAEVEMAKSLVENLSAPFEPGKYDDTYRKELLELLRAKAKGKKLPEPKEEEEGEVVDLMAALRESVERTKKPKQRKRPARKRPARKAS
jgi:DNA end-binding protein Ku